MSKKRLDQVVVNIGLAESRSKAQALILAGEILVNGEIVTKAGHSVSDDSKIELRHIGPRYVSRGGVKLAGALDHFEIDVTGMLCLDIGASTGGFTDCLLQRGAKHVFTIDVGKGQLDPKLRNDSRVTWRESFHVRKLSIKDLGEPVDLATVDVSFISLKKVLPFVLPCVRPGGILVALAKPQFEGTKKDVAGTGVVKDEKRRLEIVFGIRDWAIQELKLLEVDLADAVIEGPKGNREVFLRGLISP